MINIVDMFVGPLRVSCDPVAGEALFGEDLTPDEWLQPLDRDVAVMNRPAVTDAAQRRVS